ncbi:hypothetical protein [Pseudosulfitobacter sp. SM2401]|uniref:hypothetical protein n=1 Tax=Pseudosulfitobacter sp. SM2401 TaxID=3350098 RepID=UPI0036F19840
MTHKTARLIVWLSTAVSMVAVALIVTGWLLVGHNLGARTKVINSAAELETFLSAADAKGTVENSKSADIIRIPTGVFIQSASFKSSTDVNLIGFIWQYYPLDFPFERGFSFPEEIDSSFGFVETAYDKTIIYNGAPHQLIGSRFDVTVRQSFDYSSYPLDFLNIWLRIWPKDWTDHASIILVPDFQSYEAERRADFGLDGDLVQGEWDIVRTFFSYQNIRYDTNFGLSSRAKNTTYNEFYYNLAAERKFINAFIINLVPLLVVSLLLFSALMTISNDKEQARLFGYSASGILGTCSALFFVVLLSHIQVRGLFVDSGLVYIEYFYLVLYVMILLVALNGYLFSLTGDRRVALLHRNDNFLARVSYWPLLSWSLAGMTWWAL